MTGLADISVFSFSPHVVRQVEGNCAHCLSYSPSKFQQSGGAYTGSLMYPQRKKLGSEVRQIG